MICWSMFRLYSCSMKGKTSSSGGKWGTVFSKMTSRSSTLNLKFSRTSCNSCFPPRLCENLSWVPLAIRPNIFFTNGCCISVFFSRLGSTPDSLLSDGIDDTSKPTELPFKFPDSRRAFETIILTAFLKTEGLSIEYKRYFSNTPSTES